MGKKSKDLTSDTGLIKMIKKTGGVLKRLGWVTEGAESGHNIIVYLA